MPELLANSQCVSECVYNTIIQYSWPKCSYYNITWPDSQVHVFWQIQHKCEKAAYSIFVIHYTEHKHKNKNMDTIFNFIHYIHLLQGLEIASMDSMDGRIKITVATDLLLTFKALHIYDVKRQWRNRKDFFRWKSCKPDGLLNPSSPAQHFLLFTTAFWEGFTSHSSSDTKKRGNERGNV